MDANPLCLSLNKLHLLSLSTCVVLKCCLFRAARCISHDYVYSSSKNQLKCWRMYSGVCYNERCYNEQMLQRTVFINTIRMLQWTQMLQRMNATTNDAATNECYNERFLSIQSGCYNEHRCYNERCCNERMLQRTVFINTFRMLQWTQMLQRMNVTTNECYNDRCYNEQFLSIKSGCYNEHRCYNELCYNERCYNEQFLSIKSGCYNEHRCYNEWMLQRTMLQRTMLQGTVFINKIRKLQRTQMLQRTNATTDGFYQLI